MQISKIIRNILLMLFLGASQVHAQDNAIYDAQRNVWRFYVQDPETSQWIEKFMKHALPFDLPFSQALPEMERHFLIDTQYAIKRMPNRILA